MKVFWAPNPYGGRLASARCDVTIFGGGVFGLCAALACVDAGMSVRLVEKRRVGAGASGGLLGVLAPFAPDSWNDKKAFQLDALLSADRFWQTVASRSGLDTGYARTGRISVLSGKHKGVRAERQIAGAAENWAPHATIKRVDAPSVFADRSELCLADSLTARIAPRSALRALAKATQAAGAHIEQEAEVSLEEAEATSCDVVIACGHESADLLAVSGLMSDGVKGQAALLDGHLPADCPMVTAPGLFVVDHPGLGTAVGSTSEREWLSSTQNDDAIERLISNARARLPILQDMPILERWAGVRPRAARPDPIMGPVPGKPNLYLLSGGYGIGFGIAHEMGNAMARLIRGEDPQVPPRFLPASQLAASVRSP